MILAGHYSDKVTNLKEKKRKNSKSHSGLFYYVFI